MALNTQTECEVKLHALRSEIVRPPYIVSFSNRLSSSPISYMLVEEHIMIFCRFISSRINFCLNQHANGTCPERDIHTHTTRQKHQPEIQKGRSPQKERIETRKWLRSLVGCYILYLALCFRYCSNLGNWP